jgi:exodeoxyribonuclease III
MAETIDILSWNVNGIRAVAKKGFTPWLESCGADIVGVQEVRAERHQIDDAVVPPGWHFSLVSAAKKGYSGVGLFSRRAPDHVIVSLGAGAQDAEMDAEGRVQIARFGGLTVANVYFPNGSGKARSNDRVPFKLAFYRRLFAVLQPHLAAGEAVIVMGDFNTAHRSIDLARPKQNEGTSGFLAEERAELDAWLQAGWVDTFRAQYPDATDVYTWWSQRFGVREKNIGWRIDYVLASPGAMVHLRDAFVLADVQGSDHCPVGVRLAVEVLCEP